MSLPRIWAVTTISGSDDELRDRYLVAALGTQVVACGATDAWSPAGRSD